MNAGISEAARTLSKLASEADQVRTQIAAKAGELGLLTQQLFIIDQSMQAVVKQLRTCDIYDTKGDK